jgi:ATP-dependent DNA ligase
MTWRTSFNVRPLGRILGMVNIMLLTNKVLRRPVILLLVPLPQFQPMPLGRIRDPFSHPEWIFEIKWDGFRALLHSDKHGVRLVSRNGNVFKSFPGLRESLARDLKGRRCVLDGEIVCLDSQGKSQFRDLLFRRGEPRFYAFDLLWCEGEDLRHLPLFERKSRLRSVMPRGSERLLYCDHVEGDGEGLFRLACEHDLEGVVAKHKYSAYLTDANPTWFKIRNRSYSQWVGREELFEREREVSPDLQGWDACAIACAAAESLGVVPH